MPHCKICDSHKGFFEMSAKTEVCKKCLSKESYQEQANLDSKLQAQSIDMPITTSILINGHKIVSEHGIVSAECVFGMNVLKDIAVAFTDFTGGKSNISQKIFNDAKETAITEMKYKAAKIGANAIISVRINFNELSGGGKSGMVMVSVYGTAVKLSD